MHEQDDEPGEDRDSDPIVDSLHALLLPLLAALMWHAMPPIADFSAGLSVKYWIVAAVAAGVLTSACTRKAEGQTVAVVNGEEVTVPDLNFALDQAKVPQGADKDAVRAQVLQQLVDRRLLAEQARKEDIDKSPEFLNRERRADEDLLISMLAARRLNTTQLPSDREVGRSWQAIPASLPTGRSGTSTRCNIPCRRTPPRSPRSRMRTASTS